MFKDKTFLITGISDRNSLAMYVAKEIVKRNGNVVCVGLGKTPFHLQISDKAEAFLNANYKNFQEAVQSELPENTLTLPIDASQDESVAHVAHLLKEKGIEIHGFLHAIAMDKTIRNKQVKPLSEVSFDEFADTMNVSAYSLIRLTHYLLRQKVLQEASSVVSLSYVAADRVTFHPYKNISIAKAALERITIELAEELGRTHQMRFNAIRFSPYIESKAGNATLTDNDLNTSGKISPLGNALPHDLAMEVVHLFRPDLRITGEIRHVDGGYNKIG